MKIARRHEEDGRNQNKWPPIALPVEKDVSLAFTQSPRCQKTLGFRQGQNQIPRDLRIVKSPGKVECILIGPDDLYSVPPCAELPGIAGVTPPPWIENVALENGASQGQPSAVPAHAGHAKRSPIERVHQPRCFGLNAPLLLIPGFRQKEILDEVRGLQRDEFKGLPLVPAGCHPHSHSPVADGDRLAQILPHFRRSVNRDKGTCIFGLARDFSGTAFSGLAVRGNPWLVRHLLHRQDTTITPAFKFLGLTLTSFKFLNLTLMPYTGEKTMIWTPPHPSHPIICHLLV